MTDKVHRQMTIDQILSMFPHKAQKLIQEISNAGLHCIGCHAATWETLESGMYGHGFNDSDISRLEERLNKLLEEQSADLNTITITERAAKKYLEILEEQGKQGWGLRFSEKVSGCHGFEYVLDFSEKSLPDDQVFESKGISIHINKSMVNRLLGSEIDYLEDLHQSGFKIVSNPNAKSSCGCGNSHSYQT